MYHEVKCECKVSQTSLFNITEKIKSLIQEGIKKNISSNNYLFLEVTISTEVFDKKCFQDADWKSPDQTFELDLGVLDCGLTKT